MGHPSDRLPYAPCHASAMLRCPIVGLVGRGRIPIDAGSAAGMSDSLQFSVEDCFRPWSPGLKYVASRRPHG